MVLPRQCFNLALTNGCFLPSTIHESIDSSRYNNGLGSAADVAALVRLYRIMPSKRKRTYEASTSKKRRKQDDRIELGDPDVWEVDEILEENAGQYKISWAPNSVTGEIYPPTWEKKGNVNQEAIQDWEEKRRQRQSGLLAEKRGRGRPVKRSSLSKKNTTPAALVSNRESEQDSSPATPIPRGSRRVIDSSPSIGTQQTRASQRSKRSGVSTQEGAGLLEASQQSIPESLSTPEHRPIEIAVPQLRASQQDQFSYHDSSPAFPSSQIITGTAPQPEQSPISQPAPSQRLVDAAAAPDLTQKHSPYENVDTSGSGNNTTTTSAEASSSEVRPVTVSGDSLRPIVADSLDQVASQSYVPTTQTDSKTSNSGTTLSNIHVAPQEQVEDISDWSASSPRNPTRSARQHEIRSSVSRGVESSASSGSAIEEGPPVTRTGRGQATRISNWNQLELDSAPAALPATHVSETVEERDFASQSVPAANLPSAIIISSGVPEVSSFEETDVSQQPSRRHLVDLHRRIPSSSIDSAILPKSQSSSIELQGSAPVQPSSSQLQSHVQPGPLLQAFSPRRSQRSRRTTPKARSTSVSRLGSPFHDSRESHDRSRNSILNNQSDSTGSNFKTQITPDLRNDIGPVANNGSELLRVLQARREHQEPRDQSESGENSTFHISSGSLRQPPSQWPETFHSAPPRPATPSDLPLTPTRIMSSKSPQSAPSEPSIRIQELREAGGPITPAQRSIGMTTRSSANRAGSPAFARDARSPSAVPPAEVVPMPTAEENSTSERYLTLVPEKPQDAKRKKKALPSGIIDEIASEVLEHPLQETMNSADTTMDMPAEAALSDEFIVPLFFLGTQRDSYKGEINYKRNLIEEFLSQPWPENAPIIDRARALVAKLHQITKHPDLMNEESFTQVQTDPRHKAQWDKDTSAKFRFLHFLFAQLADHNFHLVIDVEQGRLLDILDTFLTGLNVQHVRAGTQDILSQASGLRVTLLPKHIDSAEVPKADLVIGFEGSITLIDNERKSLRSRDIGGVVPLLYLVIPKTVEHIERYLQSEPYISTSSTRRLTILIENIGLLRNEAGLRQIHDQDSQNCAASISKWLLDGHPASDWPIDELPDLTLKDPTSDSQATTASESTQPVPASSSSKRSLEDQNTPSAKKLRINPIESEIPSTINPASLSLSAITDSDDRHAVAASEYVSEIETLRHQHTARETALRNERASLAKQLADHISALEDLQYRHEEQRALLLKTREERDTAYTSAAAAAARLAGRDEVIAKIKGERDGYKLQLEEAKAALHSHVVPEVAEVEKLKSRVEEGERERVKLESRVESARREAEYVRSLYQDASSKAASLAEEKGEMEARVGELERRATSAAGQARLASKDGANQALRLEVRRLRLEVAEREKVLRGKEEEIVRLREKERGRMGTRGGSVPRSPGRLGSPMRLEPPRSSGMGSRAASPRRGSPAAGTLGTGKSKLGR